MTATVERISMDEYIRQLVDAAPPLSDETTARIVELFRMGATIE
ncbi:hypothetical protein [Rhodococcus rhodochrous]|nr:hypothetical protein [Rhodococcus rhodochrous]